MFLAGPLKFIQESVVIFLILLGNTSTHGVDIICLETLKAWNALALPQLGTLKH